MTPVKALLIFAMLASLALAALSVQTWADLRIDLRLGGLLPPEPVHGTQLTALTNAGDGRVLLLGSIMTLALSVVGILSHESRRLASAGVGLAGAGMLVLTVYVATHLQRDGDLEYWATGTKFDYRATIVPYFAIASAAVIATSGFLAYLLSPKGVSAAAEERMAERAPERLIEMVGPWTANTLRMIIWLTAALAVLAFVPWVDVHAFHAVVGHDSVTVGLADATLLCALALGCAILALRMLRDPTELVWALLVVGAGATFVVIGRNLANASADCQASITTTYLGFLSNPGCVAGNTDMMSISNGIAFLWCSMVLSLFTLLLALALPIIEMISRERAT